MTWKNLESDLADEFSHIKYVHGAFQNVSLNTDLNVIKRNKEPQPCTQCHKIIEMRNNQRFCSAKCTEAARRNRTGRLAIVGKFCEVCQKQLVKQRNGNPQKRACSLRCAGKLCNSGNIKPAV